MSIKFIDFIDNAGSTICIQVRNNKLQIVGNMWQGATFNFVSKTDAMQMLLFCQDFINRVDAVNLPKFDFMKEDTYSGDSDAIKDHPSRILDRITGGEGNLTDT